MGMRRKGRELAIQALYLMDVAKVPMEKALAGIIYGDNVDADSKKFTKRLVEGAAPMIAPLDELIQKYTKNWEVARMAALDRNILRLGAYEILHELDTPVSVIIDEAVEIAKAFSTDESGKFVNGILDKIKAERNGHEKIKQNA